MPEAVIVRSDTSMLPITLQTPKDELLLQPCEKPARDSERLGWGKGLQFDVPLRIVKLIRGKVDVDYVVHVVKPRKGKGHLELWFGPYTMNPVPSDKQFLASATFDQRYVIASKDALAPGKGGIVGVDTRGRLPNGNMWRRVAVPGDGAVYDDVEPQVAALFDGVINSACWSP